MDAFKAGEILRVAVRIEENGERLYRHAAGLADDRKLKDLFAFLASEEAKHKKTFAEMGLDRAYTGAPAEATREEGEASYEKLAVMIATEVAEGIARLVD